ncbi:MAG: hypothetical protein WC795_02220 [Candidatus Paceibacterota bacterium]|jgi:flagellar basal body-associated protein FliL
MTEDIKENNTESQAKPTSSLHTYSSDMAEAIRDGQGSVIKIAMAEQKKRDRDEENVSPQSKKNIFLIIGSGVLILLAVGAVIIYYITRPSETTIVIEDIKNKSIILADTVKVIDTASSTSDQARAEITKEIISGTLKLDSIENVIFTDTPLNPAPLSVDRLALFLDLRISPSLARSLGDYMFGIHAFNGNQPFILFKTKLYETTFAEMLSWENTLLDELAPIFAIDLSSENHYLLGERFIDTIIRNKDARAIKDREGKIIIFYLFIDKQTMIIARDPKTMDEIQNRLNVKKIN